MRAVLSPVVALLIQITVIGQYSRCYAEESGQPTIAVLNFYNLDQNKELQWLSKGLSDMLLTDLNKTGKVKIVDRERLQAILGEDDLARSASVEQRSAKVAQVTQADIIISGEFRVKNSTVVIDGVAVAIKEHQSYPPVKVEGNVGDVLKLEKQLVEKLSQTLSLPFKTQSVAAQDTTSVDAAAHFYAALDHYDNARYEQGLAETLTAAAIDTNYLPAHFWSARFYEELGEHAHEEEFLKTLLPKVNDRAYKLHLSLLLAHTYSELLAKPENAEPILKDLLANYSEPFLVSNLSLRLGEIYLKEKKFPDAYESFITVSKINDATLPAELTIPYSSVGLFGPSANFYSAKMRYKTAFLNTIYKTDRSPPPPPSMTLLSAEKPTFEKDEPNGNTSGDAEAQVVYAPPGYFFSSLRLTMETTVEQASGILRPFLEADETDFSRTWMTGSLQLTNHHGSNVLNYAQVPFRAVIVAVSSPGAFKWSVNATFIPKSSINSKAYSDDFAYRTKYLEFPVILQTAEGGAGHLNIVENSNGGLVVVYDTSSWQGRDAGSTTREQDLWSYYSPDKKSWIGPSKISVLNSAMNELEPNLTVEESGGLLLAFVSNRSGKNQLWFSRSRDGLRWAAPNRFRFDGDESGDNSSFRSVKIFQDRGGIYRIAMVKDGSGGLYVSSSTDLQKWSAPTVVDPKLAQWGSQIEYLQDRAGMYRMVISSSMDDGKMRFGSSADGIKWEFIKPPFHGLGSPKVQQDSSGRYCLLYDAGAYHFQLHQSVSRDWNNWEKPIEFPSNNNFSNTVDSESGFLLDRQGSFWFVGRHFSDRKIYIFNSKSFPLNSYYQSYVLRPDSPAEMKRFVDWYENDFKINSLAVDEEAGREENDRLAEQYRKQRENAASQK